MPIERLISTEYAAARRGLIRPGVAWPEMPPAGDPHLTVSQPSVYYGENLSGFVVVDSKQRENQPTAGVMIAAATMYEVSVQVIWSGDAASEPWI